MTFSVKLLEHGLMNTFQKNCEALLNHSDTIMIKVKAKGVYLMMTDYEGFCLVELRIMNKDTKPFINMKGKKEATVKIMLDSLIQILKNISKSKHYAILQQDKEHQLTVIETSADQKKTFNILEVRSAEHRPRAYFVLSTRSFQKTCKGEYLKFRMIASEVNRLITQLAIISGINGGKLIVQVDPTENLLMFQVSNDNGNIGSIKIRSHSKSKVVPFQHIPNNKIECHVLLTYLKRSQGFFQNQTEFLTFMVSENGLIVQNESNHQISVVMHLQDLKHENLESYA